MKVIKIQEGGKAAVIKASLPRLRPGYVIIKTVAVALNPVDWKHISVVPGTVGCTAGCDFAGVVRKVGANVTTLKVGDRVAGWTHGGNISNREDGSFAEYIVVKEGIMMKIPTGVSFAEAATLGVGISTVGQGLYQSLGLPLPTQPSNERPPLLIYGGSTATGTLAIQFAKHGFSVVTTSSPHNFDLLRSLGVDAVFDYKSPTVGADIRQFTRNKLYYAFDCVSTDESAQICAEALSDIVVEKKPAYCALNYCHHPREDVKVSVVVAYTIFGESFTKPGLGLENFPAKDEDHEFGKMFWKLSKELLAAGEFKVHPTDVRGGGLEDVLDGLAELKSGRVSGKKLVYMLDGKVGAVKG